MTLLEALWHRLPAGRYCGRMLQEVAEADPRYLLWVARAWQRDERTRDAAQSIADAFCRWGEADDEAFARWAARGTQ